MSSILTAVLRLQSIATVLLVASVVALPCAASAQTETVEYYATDAIGSVRVVFDASGNVLGRMDYAPFGQELYTGLFLPSERFAKLTRDGEAGQDYARARMFQPRVGRFSAPDPIYAGVLRPQAWNRYTYANNRPVSLVDPSGLDPEGDFDWPEGTADFFWRNEWCWTFGECGRSNDFGGGGVSGGTQNPFFPTPPPPTPPGTVPPSPPPSPPPSKPAQDGNTKDEGICSIIPSVSVSLGVNVTAGANLLFGIPFFGGGTSVSFDFSTGQVIFTGQANAAFGAGAYAGVGAQGGIAVSRSRTPAGLSIQRFGYFEANAGWGPSGGVTVLTDGSGVGGAKGLLPRAGAGYGAMAGVGAGQAVNYAFPRLWCK